MLQHPVSGEHCLKQSGNHAPILPQQQTVRPQYLGALLVETRNLSVLLSHLAYLSADTDVILPQRHHLTFGS